MGFSFWTVSGSRLSKRYLHVGYMVAEGINRASLQMCRCPSHMELMVNTSRADGSLLAIHCRGGGQLAAEEESR